MISFVVITATSKRFLRATALLALLGILLVPAWYRFGPPGGKVRWSDTVHMAANTSERVNSNRVAAELARENWWGQGIERSQSAMVEYLENPATHNAFLQMAIVYGPGQALLLFFLLVSLALRAARGIQADDALAAVLAMQLVGLFLFEEHLNNPAFIALTCWLAVASVRSWREFPLPRAAAGRAGGVAQDVPRTGTGDLPDTPGIGS
jgi:hypothetical protein